MPQIPIAISERSIPGSTGLAQMPMSSPVGEAIQRAGAQVTKMSDQFAQVEKQIQRAQQNVEASQHENQLKDWAVQSLDGYRGRTDYAQFEEDGEKQIESVRSSFGKIQDPLVRKAVEASAESVFHGFRKALIAKRAAVITDVGKASLDQNLQNDAQEWLVSTPEERSMLRDRMEARIMAQSDAGILSQSEAVNMIQGIDSKLEEAEVRGLINTDANLALKRLAAGKYKNIAPDRLEMFAEKAETKAKSQGVTALLTDLKIQFPNVEERLKHIESVDFLKTLGKGGAEIQNTLLSYTLREWKIQDEIYNKFAGEKLGVASQKIYTNQKILDEDIEGLKPKELATIEKIKDYQLRQDRADAMAERRDQREAALDRKRQELEISNGIAGQIISKIIGGDPIDLNRDIYSKIPEGLQFEQAGRLATMAGKLTDPGYKLGMNVIKKVVLDPAEQGRAILDFQTQVEAEGAKGEKIVAIAESIAKPKRQGKIAAWFNNAFKEKEPEKGVLDFYSTSPPKMADGPSQDDLEFTARKHGISVQEVKRRLGIK